MEIKSFQTYLEKRLNKAEIAEIEEQAQLEKSALAADCCSQDYIPNETTIEALKAVDSGKDLIRGKKADEISKKFSI